MIKTFLSLTLSLVTIGLAAQRVVVNGIAIQKGSGAPLSGAVVKQNRHENQSLTDDIGSFRLSILSKSDTFSISHVGFKTVFIPLGSFANGDSIILEEYALELKTVTITSRSLNFKEIENGMRLIRGPLFAHNTETTNALYNLFLSSLEEAEATEALERCDYDLSSYNAERRAFFLIYSRSMKGARNKKDSAQNDFSKYPAVNVPYEGAVLFCEWLTQHYNAHGKRKFKKVKFRLPTLEEWQIAALGYPKFQSWTLEENYVEVVIPADTVSAEFRKGNKSKVYVRKSDVWYPWYNAYNYRKKPYNHMNCYLGNFKVDGSEPVCNNVVRPGRDGWMMMSQTANYFPNDMGFYDVVGNVAEMISEEFKACGGSWNDTPANATIHSIKTYRRPNDMVGFRIFMEVLEK